MAEVTLAFVSPSPCPSPVHLSTESASLRGTTHTVNSILPHHTGHAGLSRLLPSDVPWPAVQNEIDGRHLHVFSHQMVCLFAGGRGESRLVVSSVLDHGLHANPHLLGRRGKGTEGMDEMARTK